MSRPLPAALTRHGTRLLLQRRPVLQSSGLQAEELLVTLQHDEIAIAIALRRDDVRDLAQELDDWLFDSRPGPR